MINSTDPTLFGRIVPMLDDAIAQLPESSREEVADAWRAGDVRIVFGEGLTHAAVYIGSVNVMAFRVSSTWPELLGHTG